jgi:hypothetical protein
MKSQKHKLILVLLSSLVFFSCKKEYNLRSGGTSLNMVNVMGGSTSLVAGFGNTEPIQYYNHAYQVGYGSFNVYTGYEGIIPISFVDLADTNHVLLNATVDLGKVSIYSLFLTGTVTSPDTLFIRDEIPYYNPADSVTGIRFVNLSTDSKPVSVNIAGNTNGSEIASLSYKQITEFKKYPATNSLPENGQYLFEIRDAASGELLTTCTYYVISNGITTTGKSVTVVFYGQENGSADNPVNNLVVNNY